MKGRAYNGFGGRRPYRRTVKRDVVSRPRKQEGRCRRQAFVVEGNADEDYDEDEEPENDPADEDLSEDDDEEEGEDEDETAGDAFAASGLVRK